MEEEKKEGPPVPLKPNMCKTSELFQYLKGMDFVFLLIGSLSALVSGVWFPAFVFFFGNLTDSFDPSKSGQDTLGK